VCDAGDVICQHGEIGRSTESPRQPVMSVGKSVVLNYLTNSSKQTPLSSVGMS